MPDNQQNKTDGAQAGGTPESTGNATAAMADGDSAALKGKVAELQDRVLRAQAELENFRKRARRELEDERRYAEVNLIRDLLPIIDNISRGVDAAEKKADVGTLLEAFKMINQQLESVFAKHHAKLITADDTVGQPFDPHRHEAIMQAPSEEHEHHTVLGVTQAGLELHDRIVRPAQVIVSTKGVRGE